MTFKILENKHTNQESKPHQVAISHWGPLRKTRLSKKQKQKLRRTRLQTQRALLVQSFWHKQGWVLGFCFLFQKHGVARCVTWNVEVVSQVLRILIFLEIPKCAFILPQTFWFEDAREPVKGCDVWRRVYKSCRKRCSVWRLLALLWKLYPP